MSLKDKKEEVERNVIISAVFEAGGSVEKAAKDLKVSRPTLYRLMSKHGLTPESCDELVEDGLVITESRRQKELTLLRNVHWAARGVMRYNGVDKDKTAESYREMADAVYSVNDFDNEVPY